jgi:hypothetical protein
MSYFSSTSTSSPIAYHALIHDNLDKIIAQYTNTSSTQTHYVDIPTLSTDIPNQRKVLFSVPNHSSWSAPSASPLRSSQSALIKALLTLDTPNTSVSTDTATAAAGAGAGTGVTAAAIPTPSFTETAIASLACRVADEDALAFLCGLPGFAGMAPRVFATMALRVKAYNRIITNTHVNQNITGSTISSSPSSSPTTNTSSMSACALYPDTLNFAALFKGPQIGQLPSFLQYHDPSSQAEADACGYALSNGPGFRNSGEHSGCDLHPSLLKLLGLCVVGGGDACTGTVPGTDGTKLTPILLPGSLHLFITNIATVILERLPYLIEDMAASADVAAVAPVQDNQKIWIPGPESRNSRFSLPMTVALIDLYHSMVPVALDLVFSPSTAHYPFVQYSSTTILPVSSLLPLLKPHPLPFPPSLDKDCSTIRTHNGW